jgi:hypothetical protein
MEKFDEIDVKRIELGIGVDAEDAPRVELLHESGEVAYPFPPQD